MTDAAPKPKLTFEQARSRRLTGMSVNEITALEAELIIARGFVRELRAVCVHARDNHHGLDPQSLIAAIDAMMGAAAS